MPPPRLCLRRDSSAAHGALSHSGGVDLEGAVSAGSAAQERQALLLKTRALFCSLTSPVPRTQPGSSQLPGLDLRLTNAGEMEAQGGEKPLASRSSRLSPTEQHLCCCCRWVLLAPSAAGLGLLPAREPEEPAHLLLHLPHRCARHGGRRVMSPAHQQVAAANGSPSTLRPHFAS